MSDYNSFVCDLAKNRENRTFLNSDEEHGLIVYVNLLKTARKQIRIFAGRLCEHIGNKPEFVEAISEFIERGGIVSILLNNYDEKEVVKSPLFMRLAYYIFEKKNVTVKKTDVTAHLGKMGKPILQLLMTRHIDWRLMLLKELPNAILTIRLLQKNLLKYSIWFMNLKSILKT